MRLSQLGIFAAILCPAYAFAVATIPLKAVAKNGTSITPTNSLNVSPGDLVTAEVYLSGWSIPPFDGSTGLVNSYQVTLLAKQGALSSGNCAGECNSGYILPLGRDAPLKDDPCSDHDPSCDDPCYPVCSASYGLCVGENHSPELGCTVNILRADYVFSGFDNFGAVTYASLNCRWGGSLDGNDGQTASRCQGGSNPGASCNTSINCPDGTCNANFQSYLGTVKLKVGASVCGTYTFTLSTDIGSTFLSNPDAVPVTILPAIEGLTLVTGESCPATRGACCDMDAGYCEHVCSSDQCVGKNLRFGGVLSTCETIDPPCTAPVGACCEYGICTAQSPAGCSGRWGGEGSTCGTIDPPCEFAFPTLINSPSNCTIAAQRPYPPGQPDLREGFIGWSWQFRVPVGSNEDAPDDFTVSQVPSTTPPFPPTIESVTPGPYNTLMFHFNVPTPPDRWTCVKHNASGIERCVGFLPGDVNGDRVALPNDILDLIDNLNGIVNPPLQFYQCDIDRSGVCAPADILTEIDLLNGVTGFPLQNGKTLEPCPSR